MSVTDDILRNCRFEFDSYRCSGYLYDQPMTRLYSSSRTTFAALDMPYVVKVEFGYEGPCQSWNEWCLWTRQVKGGVHESRFAATHGCSIEVQHSPLSTDKSWFVVADVQERILDGGAATKVHRRTNPCRDAVGEIQREFPDLCDLDTHQFVWSAQRNAWVLVDYGMHGTFHTRLDEDMWAQATADVPIGEKVVLG